MPSSAPNDRDDGSTAVDSGPAPRPAPGSAAAAAIGCRCPVLVNGPRTPVDELLIAPDCALHSPARG